jgi:hypothetical protein
MGLVAGLLGFIRWAYFLGITFFALTIEAYGLFFILGGLGWRICMGGGIGELLF